MEEESGEKINKRAAQKETAELETLRRLQEQEEAARKTASLSLENDEFSSRYGDVTPKELQLTEDPKAGKWSEAVEGKEWTDVNDLVEGMAGSEVLIRGRVHTIRPFSNKVFVILRQSGSTVQCVAKQSDLFKVGVNMIKFLRQLSNESVVDVIGGVVVPKDPVTSTTQQKVEIQVRKLYCVDKVLTVLPFTVEDAARSEAEIEKSLQTGTPAVRVNQDTRLNNRVLDLRTPANQAIFRIKCQVESAFMEFLLSKGFVMISPISMGGSSEGGSAVFRFNYKGQPASLAQSPQLHMQMAICGDVGRVFEIGPVFSHRHLCELVGLDVQMEIQKHYSEIMDLVDKLFVFIFTSLNEKCKMELEAVGKQYPFEPLKFLPKTLRLTFEEGVQMLKEAGVEVDPLGDLNTESERKLGQLVLEK